MDLKELYSWFWNNEQQLLDFMSYVMIGISLVVAVLLNFVNAPYGRYSSCNWGFLLNAKAAWMTQELPALIIPVLLIQHARNLQLANTVLCIMFIAHYTQRSLVFPMLMRGGKPTPFIPFFMAFVFCFYNGYLQSRHLTTYTDLPRIWHQDPRFILGVALFAIGMAINIHSDHVLRNLRKPGEKGYKIPRGGMFEYVSGANFLGEIVEWGGFALACWSLPALAFFLFTALNIGPRACSHHRWYLEKFEDYPANRRAIIPFLL